MEENQPMSLGKPGALNILVVDDSAVVREVMTAVLGARARFQRDRRRRSVYRHG